MLAISYNQAGHDSWRASKHQQRQTRMSDNLITPSSSQPEWREQYSYVDHGRPDANARDEERVGIAAYSEPRVLSESAELDIDIHKQTLDTTIADAANATIGDSRALPPLDTYGQETSSIQGHHQQSDETTWKAIDPTDLATPILGNTDSQTASRDSFVHNEQQTAVGDDENFDDEDDLMGEDDDAEVVNSSLDRASARRKMKRFRLTHSQTRFLMSEFAKQPHPDAAHRERLSKEIPGLSPRQVQVWFQNRRAKIKRLAVDDRDRMIQMRAVPDDFDNVQALHSPYGAVQGFGFPLASPRPFGLQSSLSHGMRPILANSRHPGARDCVQQSPLTPSFAEPTSTNIEGLIDLNASSPTTLSQQASSFGNLGTMRSPAASGQGQQFPISARRSSIDTALQGSPRQARPFPHLSMQHIPSQSGMAAMTSPVGPGVSWQPDRSAYMETQNLSPSSIYSNSQPMFSPRPLGPDIGQGPFGYHPANEHDLQPTPRRTFPLTMPPGLQNRSRLRAASASMPLNLDLSGQRRQSEQIIQSPHPSNRSARPLVLPHGAPELYTTSYPAAPLTAPIRTGENSEGPVQGAQMSAPMAPPPDFSQRFIAESSAMSSQAAQGHSASGPVTHGSQEPEAALPQSRIVKPADD